MTPDPPYHLNLVAVANMCVKNTSRFMGGCTTPFGVPRKPHSTHLKNENFQPKTLELILMTLAKYPFRFLKNEVRNQIKNLLLLGKAMVKFQKVSLRLFLTFDKR